MAAVLVAAALVAASPALPVAAQTATVDRDAARARPDAPAAGEPESGAVPLQAGAREIRRGNKTARVRPLQTVRTADGREALADRVIVGFHQGVPASEWDGVHAAARGRGVANARAVGGVGPRAQLVEVSSVGSLDETLQKYRADPRVRYAEPDYVRRRSEVPSDPGFAQQWGMSKIAAPAAWNTTHGSPTVYIAVLDCGIYDEASTFPSPDGGPGHPDLRGKVVLDQDFSGSPFGADDYCDHGTHVAGIAAASTNNGLGVAGVGYSTRLLNGKVLNDFGEGLVSWEVSGIYWAVDNGARVINLSLGSQGACSASEQQAIDYAWSHNVVVVAAAGNDGTTETSAPANCARVLSVASTDADDARSSFSNYGPWVDVAAPGTGIYSTDYVGSYAIFSGTSMATPHVSGLAGLLWATGWGTSAESIVNRIKSTADAVPGTGSSWESGRISASRAVIYAPSCTAVPVSGSPASPQPEGANVALNAVATCGGAPAEYQWWMRPPGGAWSVVRSWGTTPGYPWATAGQPVGLYTFQVAARAVGSTAPYEAYAVLTYQLSGRLCTAVTTSASPASPRPAGANVALGANAACGGAPAEYQWSARPPGGAWALVRNWGTDPAYSWATAGLPAGAYKFQVAVRRVGSTATYEAYSVLTYELSSAGPCTAVTASATPASPQPVGTSVALGASAACGGGPAEYRWSARPPGGAWALVRDWGTTPGYSWATAGLPAGTYKFQVEARTVGSTATYEAYSVLTFQLAGGGPCTVVTASATPASPQPAGTSVALGASAACGGGPAEYRWSARPPGGAWALVRDWGTDPAYPWATAGLPAGAYKFQVEARAVGSAAAYEAYSVLTFQLQ